MPRMHVNAKRCLAETEGAQARQTAMGQLDSLRLARTKELKDSGHGWEERLDLPASGLRRPKPAGIGRLHHHATLFGQRIKSSYSSQTALTLHQYSSGKIAPDTHCYRKDTVAVSKEWPSERSRSHLGTRRAAEKAYWR